VVIPEYDEIDIEIIKNNMRTFRWEPYVQRGDDLVEWLSELQSRK
jgi:hypothetical protein